MSFSEFVSNNVGLNYIITGRGGEMKAEAESSALKSTSLRDWLRLRGTPVASVGREEKRHIID